MDLTLWRDTTWEVAKLAMAGAMAFFVLCLSARFIVWCAAVAWGSMCRSWASRHDYDDDGEVARIETPEKIITVNRVRP